MGFGNQIGPPLPVQAPPAPPTMDETRATEVLERDFAFFDTAARGGSGDGRISRGDIEAIRDREPPGSERAQAAQFLLDHPEAFERLDTAWRGGDADGIVSRDDVRTAAANTAMARDTALQTVHRHFATFDTAAKGGDGDGKISRGDLQAVRDDPTRPEPLRQAAAFLLEQGGLHASLDTAGAGSAGDTPDGVISRDDLAAASLRDPPSLPLLASTNVTGGDAPTVLQLQGTLPAGTQWGNAANPAGTVSVYVDGAYYADATLLSESGGRAQVNLGALPPGEHRIELRDSSTGGTGGIRPGITDLSVSTEAATGTDALAARYAPVVHLIDDDQAGNNTPLQTVARVTHNADGTTTVAYSVLFSNEDDGYGKHPAELADSWGRVTDDERLYEITFDAAGTPVAFDSHDGRLGSAEGAEDVAALLAQHSPQGQPEVSIVDGHNKYDWTEPGSARDNNRAFAGAPLVVDGDATTPEVMNQQPYLWQVSNREIAREGETAQVEPLQRLYLSRNAGSFSDVARIEVTLQDGSRVVVHEGGLADHDAVSLVLRDPAGNPIDPAQVASVEVVPRDGETLDVGVQRLTPEYLPIELPVT